MTTEAVRPFHTDIPARLDRLPWSRWHWLVVVALDVTWVIDGLEVTLVGAISTVLVEPGTLHLSPPQVGLLNTAYLVGAVLGALVVGYLTDKQRPWRALTRSARCSAWLFASGRPAAGGQTAL